MRGLWSRAGVRRWASWSAAAGALAACGYYLARQIDPAALGRALAGADYGLVSWMTAGHLVILLPIKAWRWERMLAPIRRVRVAALYRYCLAGCAVSNLLPARAGHAARVLLVRRDGVPVAGAVGVLVLEELCNAAVLGLLCLPVPFLLPLPGRLRATLAFVTVGAAIGVAILFWLALSGKEHQNAAVRRFSEGVAVLTHARGAGFVFALTIALWMLDLGQIALAMAAVKMTPSYAGVALVLLAVNLTNALPATPGQVGLFEAGAAAACMAVGAPAEQGLAVGVLYHMMQFIPETALGLLVIARSALGWSLLRSPRPGEEAAQLQV